MTKVKIIRWKKEFGKVVNPLNKKMDQLFKEFDKEVSEKSVNRTPEQNALWRKKYRKKYEDLEKRIDRAYEKLWLKYYTSTNSRTPRPGYKIV